MEPEETVGHQVWEAFLPLVAVVALLPGLGRANRARPVQMDGQVAVVLSTLRARLQEQRVRAVQATRVGILMPMALLRTHKLLAVVGVLAVPEATPQRVLEETGVQVSRVRSLELPSVTEVAEGAESERSLGALDSGSMVVAMVVLKHLGLPAR